MKIVSKVYDENNVKMLVSDKLVKTGYFFGEQDDLLLDIEKGQLEQLLNDFKASSHILFWVFLHNNVEEVIEFTSLPYNRYVSEEELEEMIAANKYFYNSNDHSIDEAKGVKIYQLSDYIEYWNGREVKQEEVYIHEEDITLVEENIAGNFDGCKIGQIDLYKLQNGSHVINHDSYYIGDLGHCEAITTEELKDKYGYTVEEENEKITK